MARFQTLRSEQSMKMKLIIVLTMVLGSLAHAQGTPVPKIGGSCPTGTRTSQGSCVPVGNTQVFITSGGCPQGWVRSGNGNYCVR